MHCFSLGVKLGRKAKVNGDAEYDLKNDHVSNIKGLQPSKEDEFDQEFERAEDSKVSQIDLKVDQYYRY